MTQASTATIKKGWQVYAGPDRIGEVTRLHGDSLAIRSGRLIKHEYLIPLNLISDAADGVVDLKVGRDALPLVEI
jgi:hypothetical protein